MPETLFGILTKLLCSVQKHSEYYPLEATRMMIQFWYIVSTYLQILQIHSGI